MYNSRVLQQFGVLILFIIATACRCDEAKKIKDFNYLLTKDEVYTRQISPTGRELTLGYSKSDYVAGTGEFRCQRLSDSKYDDKFGIKTFEIPSRGGFARTNFIYIARELWNCTDSKQEQAFLRIVNEAICKDQISLVKFYDGTEITTRNYEGSDKFSMRMKEIKYYGEKKIRFGVHRDYITFDGLLTLEKDETAHSFPNFLKEHHRCDAPEFSDKLSKVTISGDGKTLRIGKSELTVEKNGDNEQKKLKCRLGADVSLYSPVLLPSIEEEVNSAVKLFAKLSDEDFFKQFVIIKRNIYYCTPQQESDGSWAILRVENDVIGTIEIKDLHYSPKIVLISSIYLPRNKATARFKEVKYLHIGDDKWSERFYNNIEIDEESVYSRVTKDNSKDLEYLLAPMSVFRTFVGQRGYDLRIGEAYRDMIGNGSYSVKCDSKNDDRNMIDFRTVVKVKLKNGALHSLAPIQNDLVYKVVSQEAFVCSDARKTIKFLRIVNEIEFTVQVQSIDTYDGVDIVEKIQRGTAPEPLRIIEKKYLDFVTHKPVKYVGEISFVGAEVTKDRKFPVIRKTIDDTTCLFGYTAKILPSLTDINARSCFEPPTNGNEIALETEGLDLTFMEPTFQRKQCDDFKKNINSRDIALCEDVSNSHSLPIPNIKLSDGEGNSEVVTNKYFTTKTNIVSHCKNENMQSKQPKNFKRIVTSKVLNKKSDVKVKKMTNYPGGSIRLEMKGNEWNLFYEDVRYVDDSNIKVPPILIPFAGFIVFPDKKQEGPLKSGTESIVNMDLFRLHIGNERIKYIGNPFYTSYINVRGDSLELGSKIETRISGEEMTCHLRQEENKRKEYDTIIIVRGNKKIESKFQDYFEDLKQEVWVCADMHQSQDILRVVNRFKVKLEKMSAIKEINHYQGLSIILGETSKKPRLEITEVKYLMSKDNVVDYKGEVYLSGAKEDSLALKPNTLENPARRDFHYTLQKNELFRTVLDEYGDILEIGQHFDEPMMTSLEQIICQKPDSNAKYKVLRPIVVIYKTRMNQFYPQKMDDAEFSEYFELKTEVSACNRKNFFRVKNILTQKKTKSGRPISHVYHRDGITVISGKELTIEEIKYVSKPGEGFITMKFEGFVTIEDEENPSARSLNKGSVLVNDMNKNILDKNNYQVAGPEGCRLDECKPSCEPGPIFEVGSLWHKELEVTDKVMICEEELNVEASVSEQLEMLVKVMVVENNDIKWIDIWTLANYFGGISQQVWICRRANDLPIYKVRNYMVVKTDVARIYHADGVSVNVRELPDSSKYVELVEDKFTNLATSQVLKYDGELRIEAKRGLRIRQKYFSLDYKEQSLSTTDQSSYLSMNAAVVMLEMSSSKNKKAMETNVKRRSKMFHVNVFENGTRTVRVGTDEGEVYSPSQKPTCILHTWNSKYSTKYVPKLVEYYNDNLYEIEEEMFHFFFNIIQQDVRLCAVEKDVFFKIETHFELLSKHKTVGEIKVISLHGSVEPILKEKSKEINYFTDTVFIDAKTNKYLKFRGKWLEVNPLITTKKGSFKRQKSTPKTDTGTCRIGRGCR